MTVGHLAGAEVLGNQKGSSIGALLKQEIEELKSLLVPFEISRRKREGRSAKR